MNASDSKSDRQSTNPAAYVSWGWVESPNGMAPSQSAPLKPPAQPAFDLFKPVRQWLDCLVVNDIKLAHFLCKSIPSQCPFERDIKLFNRTLFHIPPLCKLNPVYDEVVALRFRALCYLADVCGEDVTPYC